MDSSPPPATPQPPADDGRPTPGEVVRPAQRALDRPPSERYAGAAETAPTPSGSLPRALVGAVAPAAIGGVVLVVLGSVVAISEPLVIVALLLGLGTGVGTRRGGGTWVPIGRRRAIGVVAALAVVGLAEVAIWQLAIGQGGVLSFLDYQGLVFGPIAVLQPIVAGTAAWATA